MSVLFGFFGLPPIIRAEAIKRLSRALHRDVSIESVRVNPLVFSVTIDGLAVKDRDGGPFAGWRRLYVNFDSWSVFVGEWRFQEISLDGFSGRAELKNDGSFNFSDLVPPPVSVSSPAAASKSARPLRIKKLSVSAAAVNFSDHTRAAPFATSVGPVSFTIENFRTAGDPRAPYSFSAVTEAGETLNWRGTLSVDPLRSAGYLGVAGLSLKKYAPYYAGLMRADVLGGLLDVNAHYALDFGAAPRVLALDNASIKITSLQVAERGANTPVIEVPSCMIEGLSAAGLKPSATIKRITLDQPSLHVRREKDGSLNLSSLRAPAPAVLPDVKIGEFAINGLSVALEDLSTPTPTKITVEKTDLVLKNVSLAEGAAPIAVKLSATLPPGGEVAVEGELVRAPLSADVTLKVATLPLAGLTPYLEQFLNLRITSGTASVDGRARLVGSAVSFQGDVNVAGFAAVHGKQAEDFAKFSSVNILGIDATSRPFAARIAEINLIEPVVRCAINADGSSDLASVLRRSAPSKIAPVPAWSLEKFTLTNGKFILNDRSVKPVVRIALDQLSGTVTGLSSDGLQPAGVDFRGRVDGAGSVAVAAKLNARAATDIVVGVKDVDLSPFSPYAETYAGCKIARGGLAANLNVQLAQGRLDGAGVVTLNPFALEAATGSAGVDLLKDSDGNIVINVPVKGALNDPAFKIGGVVRSVIGDLLAKAKTSPFALIGSMFGGGGDELAFQDFSPGGTVPVDGESGKIATLRKALASRPALALEIAGSYDPVADTEALRRQRLDQQIAARLCAQLPARKPAESAPDKIIVSPDDEVRLVRELFAARFPAGAIEKADGAVMAVALPKTPPPPKPSPYNRRQLTLNDRPVAPAPFVPVTSIVTLSSDMKVQRVSPAPTLGDMRRLLATDIAVTDDDLRQLAAMRARQVRDALLAGGEIDAKRVFLATAPAPGKGARVLLQLK